MIHDNREFAKRAFYGCFMARHLKKRNCIALMRNTVYNKIDVEGCVRRYGFQTHKREGLKQNDGDIQWF